MAAGAPLPPTPHDPRGLGDVLRLAAERFPDRAIVHVRTDGSTSHHDYAQTWERSLSVLAGLRDEKIEPGMTVLLLLPDTADFVAALWGCVLGGVVCVPLTVPARFEPDQASVRKLLHAWSFLGARRVLTAASLLPELARVAPQAEALDIAALLAHAPAGAAARHRPDMDDPALMLLTSGSTGRPKAVVHTHRTLIRRTWASVYHTGLTEADTSLNWLPLDHVGGVLMYHLPEVFAGAGQVQVQPDAVLQDPLRWLDLLHEYRATRSWAPNFAFALVNDLAERLEPGRWDLSRLDFLLNGGEALVPATARRSLELLEPFGLRADAMVPAWGMSETGSAFTYHRGFTRGDAHDDDVAVSVGGVIAGGRVRIADGRGRTLPEGQPGRLQVAGEMLTPGYHGDAAATAEAWSPDGWFDTGDLAYMADGRVTVTGRHKDEIIVRGVNFAAHEIEAVAESVAGVLPSFAAACPVRLARHDTDAVAVFLAPAAGIADNDEELRRLLRTVRERISAELGLDAAMVIPVREDQVPKTNIGKIQRAALRQRLETGGFEAQASRGRRLVDPGATVPAWFYEPLWRPRRIGPASAPASVGILGGGPLFAESLPAALRQRGVAACVIDPDHLTGPLESHTVIWEAQAGDNDADADALLRLARMLAQSPRVRRVIAVSGPAAGEGPDPRQAAVVALVRSLAAEHPRLTCRHVALPGDDPRLADLLADEAAADDAFPQVRYHGGQRETRMIRPVTLPADAADGAGPGAGPGAPVPPGAGFLITGGLGGIGRALAEHLLTNHGARLLLVGRSPLDDGRRALLASLERLGDVAYAAADVCDAAALEQVAARAEARWGRPLTGAFHLAGTFHETPLDQETAEAVRRAMRPKLAGAQALIEVLGRRPEALLVGFGSMIGAMGAARSGAYAAANAALAAALAAAARPDLRTLCIHWSMWQGTGMSHGLDMTQAREAAGFVAMAPRQALASLDLALAHAPSGGAWFIGLDGNRPAVRPQIEAPVQPRRELVACCEAAAAPDLAAALKRTPLVDAFGVAAPVRVQAVDALPVDAAGAVDPARLDAMLRTGAGEADAPATDTERRVAALLENLLGATGVTRQDSFLLLGGNSLLATQLIARLRSDFPGRALSLRDVLEHPTVAALAATLDAASADPAAAAIPPAAIPAVETMSDGQVDAMLAQMLQNQGAS